ncbi:MAG: hypothetical protein GTN40_02365 [Candidatus Aenigmarchaeota archaeon]|nr:hypothetical protein [Candidatus Aenigmarchaeota archaeon]
MKTPLKQYHRETLENSKAVVVDLSDTTVNGNASYGAFYLPWKKAKEGKILDALRLGLNGIRIYAVSHLPKRFSSSSEWDRENQTLKDVYQCLDKCGIKGEEMEEAAGKYIKSKMFRIPGAKSFLQRIRNFGERKKVYLLTRESSECAKAAKNHFGFDKCISNITRLNKSGIINDVQIIMKKPEDKPSLLQKELEKDGLGLKDVVMISDNPEDPDVFKGEVGLFVTYRNGKGELNINDYREFERQLINPD